MLSLSGLCTVLVIGVLFFILGYLFFHGARSLNCDFFTNSKALGRNRRRHGERDYGKLARSRCCYHDRSSHWISRRRLPGRVQRQDFRFRYSIYRRPFERRAVHRDRYRRLCRGRAAHEAFLRTGRRCGSRHHDDSHCGPHHRRISAGRSEFVARRAHGLGATKAKTIFSVVVPAAISGLDLRNDAQPGASRRRNGASAVHGTGQHVLEPRLDAADRNSSGHDLQLCDLAGRRSSPAGLGRGLRIARAGPG